MKKLAPGDWVVVCDGHKALILENTGDELQPNLKMREQRQTDTPPTHVQGADRPGKVHQSTGSARSAVAQTDWHDQAEQLFIKSIAKRINDAATKGETTGVVLIAPPRALGVLRAALSPAVARLVHTEIDKDFVHLPIAEIEKRLRG